MPGGDDLVARLSEYLSQRIRSLRMSIDDAGKPLSQRALAERAGMSPTSISEIEAGKYPPSVASLLLLTHALGLATVEELLGDLPELPSRTWGREALGS